MRPDPDRFAQLFVGYCLDVQPGQQVLVRSTTLAAPLLLAVQRAILERDAWPLLRPRCPARPRTTGPRRATPISTPTRRPSSPTPRARTAS